jgi:uncharacterized cupin superfamily protein/GNAT superfamily N-acetyltransferase
MKTRPNFIKNVSELHAEDEHHYRGSDELLSVSRPIGREAGLLKYGVNYQNLKPGRRTSFPHAESTEEEFVFVLEGTPVVWIDGDVYALKPGDFVAFPAGTGIAHTFINNSNQDAVLLVGGERREDDKVYYPLNPERKAQIGNQWWSDVPQLPQGPHDGLPDLLRERYTREPQSVTVGDVRIRRARLADAAAIHEAHMTSIQQSCARDYTSAQIEAWGRRPFDPEKLGGSIANHFVWVVETQHGIQGFLDFVDKVESGERVGWLYAMYLTPQVQGRGVAKELLRLVERTARHINVKAISCQATRTAFRFYESQGFRRTGEEVPHMVRGVAIPSIPMTKTL